MQLSWTGRKIETKELACWTTKQLIAGRALYPKSNVMRIYIKHRYGGPCLISVQECCAAELKSIDFYLVNSEEEILEVVTRLEKLEKYKIEGKKDYNNRIHDKVCLNMHWALCKKYGVKVCERCTSIRLRLSLKIL